MPVSSKIGFAPAGTSIFSSSPVSADGGVATGFSFSRGSDGGGGTGVCVCLCPPHPLRSALPHSKRNRRHASGHVAGRGKGRRAFPDGLQEGRRFKNPFAVSPESPR